MKYVKEKMHVVGELWRVAEIPGPTRKVYQGPPYDEEDQQYEVYGSAEEDQDELSNSVQVVGGWGQTPTSGVPSKGTLNTMHAVDSPAASGAARVSSPVNFVILFLGLPWIKKFFPSEIPSFQLCRSTALKRTFILIERPKVFLKSVCISIADNVPFASSLGFLVELYERFLSKVWTHSSPSLFNRIYTSTITQTNLKWLYITRRFRIESGNMKGLLTYEVYPLVVCYFSKINFISHYIFRVRQVTLLPSQLLWHIVLFWGHLFP